MIFLKHFFTNLITGVLIAVRQEVKNLQSSRVVQELELGINFALMVFVKPW